MKGLGPYVRMERKKGIDHEAVGTEVSKREDERQDITNNPPDRPAKQQADLSEDGDHPARDTPDTDEDG